MISDNVLFVMLLAVLGLALLLRSVIRDSAPTSKIGYAATSAAIAGVASVVVGGLLLKFFPESGTDMIGAVLMVVGFIAITLGVVISLAAILKEFVRNGAKISFSSITPLKHASSTNGSNDKHDNYFDYFSFIRMQNAVRGDSNNIEPTDQTNYSVLDDFNMDDPHRFE